MKMSENPRVPSNLQGLMKFAIEATGSNSNVQSESSRNDEVPREGPIDPERRQWLENALTSMMVNVVEEMYKAIEILKLPNEDEDDLQKKEQALDSLLNYVDNVDFANDFYKIGGFDVLAPGLKSTSAKVRSKTGELIAELMQNNPFCQEKSVNYGLLDLLIYTLDNDEDENVRIKALYALSCLLRSNPEAIKQFRDRDGFSSLLRAMQSPVERLKIKASFLVSCLCSQQPQIRDILCEMGFVVQLVGLIQSEHDQSHEHLLSALCTLATKHPAAIKECQDPTLRLRETLEERMKLLKGHDENMEELEYCEQLMNICFTYSPSENNKIDDQLQIAR